MYIFLTMILFVLKVMEEHCDREVWVLTLLWTVRRLLVNLRCFCGRKTYIGVRGNVSILVLVPLSTLIISYCNKRWLQKTAILLTKIKCRAGSNNRTTRAYNTNFVMSYLIYLNRISHIKTISPFIFLQKSIGQQQCNVE